MYWQYYSQPYKCCDISNDKKKNYLNSIDIIHSYEQSLICCELKLQVVINFKGNIDGKCEINKHLTRNNPQITKS